MKTLKTIIFLSLFNLPFLADASRNKEAETTFSSSPNDVSQLLSSLERENVSLIAQTPATPIFRKIQNDIETSAENTGNNFGFEYIPLYQYAALGHPQDNASGGEFEIFGQYYPFGIDESTTTIGYKIEQKHAYGKIPPGMFNEQMNSIIRTVSGYENLKPAITELWYQQHIIPKTLVVRLGKVKITSVMNNYAFDSRKFYYLSDVFTSHPAIDEPSRGLGIIAGLKLHPHIYAAATVVDASGEENTSGFKTFGRGEFFSAIELGYRDIVSNPSSDNYHIFIWQTASRKHINRSNASGYAILLQKNIHSRLIPFAKLAVNHGKNQDIKRLVMGGFGYHYPLGGKYGLIGFGAGYATLSALAFENEKTEEEEMKRHEQMPHGGHQVIFETYYRIQLTPYSQLTPDIEIIKILPNEKHHHRWATVASIRWRTAI